MSKIKNKKLFEDDLVKQIVKNAVIRAINLKISINDVTIFINENFDKIVNDIIVKHE